MTLGSGRRLWELIWPLHLTVSFEVHRVSDMISWVFNGSAVSDKHVAIILVATFIFWESICRWSRGAGQNSDCNLGEVTRSKGEGKTLHRLWRAHGPRCSLNQKWSVLFSPFYNYVSNALRVPSTALGPHVGESRRGAQGSEQRRDG